MDNQKQILPQKETVRERFWFFTEFLFLLIKYLAFSSILRDELPWFGLNRAAESPQNALYIVLVLAFLFFFTVLLNKLQRSFPSSLLLPALFIADPFCPLCFCTLRSLVLGILLELLLLFLPKMNVQVSCVLAGVYCCFAVVLDASVFYGILPLTAGALYAAFCLGKQKECRVLLFGIPLMALATLLCANRHWNTNFFSFNNLLSSTFDANPASLQKNGIVPYLFLAVLAVLEIVFFVVCFRSKTAKEHRTDLVFCVLFCALPILGFVLQKGTLGFSSLTLSFSLSILILSRLHIAPAQKLANSQSTALVLFLLVLLSWAAKSIFQGDTLLSVLNAFAPA